MTFKFTYSLQETCRGRELNKGEIESVFSQSNTVTFF